MDRISAADLLAACDSEDGRWPVRTWALLDVRELGEAQKGHIPGATFLPRRMIEFRLQELVPTHGTRIVVYDDGDEDRRAACAAKTIKEFGYVDVCLLEGGIQAWTAAGNEVATGWNVPCKDFGERLLVSSDVPYITADDLAARIDAGENIGVFDVRTPQEYREGSLPLSTSAPSFDWSLHVDDWAENYAGIVIHCAGRTRSIFGTETGRLLGLKNLWALENGTMGWRLSDRDLAACQDRILPAPSAKSIDTVRRRALNLTQGEGVEILSPDDLSRRMDAGAERPVYVFDVRDAAAFMDAHICGSIWLPGGQACQRADDFAAVPGADIVFADENDSRAAVTAYWYRRMGFPNVSILAGGVEAWRAEGLPVATGRDRSPPIGLKQAEQATRAYDPDALAAALGETPRPVVIDVGKSSDFEACHVEGAVWIPRGYLEARIAGAVQLGERVIVTSRDPAQAAFGAAALAGAGFADVGWLKASGKEWAGALPTATGFPDGNLHTEDALAIPYRKTKKEMVEYLEWEEKLGQKYKSADADPRG